MYIDFCLKNYRTLIQRLKSHYALTNFKEYILLDQSAPFVILRHDVDVCLESALKIAQVESEELAISSTYFILHSSPHYTFLDPKSVKIVKEVNKLGHEIGFHYDCATFELVEDQKSLLLKMIEIFENLCEVKVTSISCHNPSLISTDCFLGISGYTNAYSPAFTKDMFYVSDSVATWRKGALEKILTQPVKPKVQLLLHPFLWAVKNTTVASRYYNNLGLRGPQTLSGILIGGRLCGTRTWRGMQVCWRQEYNNYRPHSSLVT